jgi:hypothetical protein
MIKIATCALGLIALAAPGFGFTCSGTTFTLNAGDITTSGFTSDSAKACVTINSSTQITVVLENTTTGISNVPNELVGFSFSLSGGGSVTGSLGTVTAGIGTDPIDGHTNSATPYLDCSSGTCTKVSTFVDVQGSTTETSPFEWGLATGSVTYGSSNTSGSFSGTNPGFFAGQTGATTFSLHPAAIVNDSAVGPNQGLQSGPHNDLLLDDVSFVLTCTGCSTTGTTVSSGTFYWGTDGISGGGGNISSVPEPSAVALFGGILALTARGLRRRSLKA